jgi:hypothetical protein
MQKDQHDTTLEESFPASDPPATSGVTGPRVNPPAPDQDKKKDKPED